MKDNKKNKEKDAAQQDAQAKEAPPQPDSEAPAKEEEGKVTITREKLEELNAYVKQAEAKRDEYLSAAQRVQADFDNYRKRNAALRTEVADDTLRDTLKEILPSLDNLERALAAAQAAGEDGGLYKGVEMTLRGLEEALQKMGLERVDAAPGVSFDPEKHNAVMMSEADEEHPEGTILECFQTGFAVKGKVIRYAMVRVAN
jgi:molecular chaperone GrpE